MNRKQLYKKEIDRKMGNFLEEKHNFPELKKVKRLHTTSSTGCGEIRIKFKKKKFLRLTQILVTFQDSQENKKILKPFRHEILYKETRIDWNQILHWQH